MNLTELLRMSSSNLRRRKLRTFLTVLGVVIGTASIVVMVSLGLGMQKSMYQEIEQYGGLTTIKVYGAGSEEMMGYSMGGEEQEASEEYVDDHCIETLGKIEHVESAQPVYQMSVLLLKGSYEGYTELLAMTPEGLKSRKIDLEEGQLPESNRGQLELVYGNQLLTNFTEKGSGNGYWDTGELPDIDLAKDSLFLILDMDNYYSSQERSPLDAGSSEEGAEGGGTSAKPIQVQKHVVKASGVVAGGIDEYNANSYYAFCDLETLKQLLKKEFSGRAIPGQPQTKNGKPMNKFCYTYAEVKVDDADRQHETSDGNHTGSSWRYWCSLFICSCHRYCEYDDDVHLREDERNRCYEGAWMQSQKHQENVPEGSGADWRDLMYHRKYIKLSHIGSYQYTGVKCRSYE